MEEEGEDRVGYSECLYQEIGLENKLVCFFRLAADMVKSSIREL